LNLSTLKMLRQLPSTASSTAMSSCWVATAKGKRIVLVSGRCLSEQNLTETVTFAVSLDSGIVLAARHGHQCCRSNEGWLAPWWPDQQRNNNTVTIDSTEDLSVVVANGATLTVMMPTGLAELRPIQSISGTTVSHCWQSI
jgi:hypothetical protein